ncbi:CBS domain-containing protein, partial [Actinomadura sp. 3N407]|uniref:CBS domain-containing protein n=1 Tax=Actinomadura sp. 3N407 TaxID=3457423 RepID=UPI003FCE7568
MRIGEILEATSTRDVVTISPDAGVRDLIALLAEHNIGALVVSSDGTTLDGIVSERDVVRHLHSDGTVINNTVAAIMTPAVETCAPDDDLDEVMATMTARRFR